MMLDEIRAQFPDLGFAIYAYEPGGAITVEVLTPDGARFTRQAPTMTEALAGMFGLPTEETPDDLEARDAEPEPDIFS